MSIFSAIANMFKGRRTSNTERGTSMPRSANHDSMDELELEETVHEAAHATENYATRANRHINEEIRHASDELHRYSEQIRRILNGEQNSGLRGYLQSLANETPITSALDRRAHFTEDFDRRFLENYSREHLSLHPMNLEHNPGLFRSTTTTRINTTTTEPVSDIDESLYYMYLRIASEAGKPVNIGKEDIAKVLKDFILRYSNSGLTANEVVNVLNRVFGEATENKLRKRKEPKQVDVDMEL